VDSNFEEDLLRHSHSQPMDIVSTTGTKTVYS